MSLPSWLKKPKAAPDAASDRLDQAIATLNRCRHRLIDTWYREVIRPDTPVRISARHQDGHLIGPVFNSFEAIAIAERYERES